MLVFCSSVCSGLPKELQWVMDWQGLQDLHVFFSLLFQSVQSVHFVSIESTVYFSPSAWPSCLCMLILLFFFFLCVFQFPFFWGYCLHGDLFQQLLNHHGVLLPGRASVGICCFLWYNEHQFSFQTVCFSGIWFVALFSNKNILSDTFFVKQCLLARVWS